MYIKVKVNNFLCRLSKILIDFLIVYSLKPVCHSVLFFTSYELKFIGEQLAAYSNPLTFKRVS